MSLIQDALKRQQEEAERARPRATPPPLPAMPAPAAPVPAHTGRQTLGLLAFVVSTCLLALTVWAVFFGLPEPLLRVVAAVAPGLAARWAPPQPEPAEEASAAAEWEAASVQAPEPAPEAVPELAAAASSWLSAAAAAAPAFADEGEENAEPAAPPAPPPEPESAPHPAPAAPPWPRLTLSAVFRHAGSGQAAARLNDRLVRQGGDIDGVTVEEIRSDGVLLSRGGERRSLKVGGTLF